MIYCVDGFKTKLEKKYNYYNIFTYKRLILKPMEKQIIQLPICINSGGKLAIFETDKKLCMNGISIIWTNINEESAKNNVELLVLNSNFDYESLYGNQSPLSRIVGSNNKVDLTTETLLGRISFIDSSVFAL